MRLVLATANEGKISEIRSILAGVELLARPPGLGEVQETAATLEGNARMKAAAVMHATGEPAVADDTGLEVEALGGAPGVRSARYAGDGATPHDNVVKLLAALEGVDRRRARFRTVALLLFPDGAEVVAEGVVEGSIAPSARGSGGFGYDPVFVPDEPGGMTFAEMPASQKNAVSHRGRAFRALAARLGA